MAVKRPTFSESWYRVAELKPRLRSTIQVHRQTHRGRIWYVLQDPGNNDYSRLGDSAYAFVSLLDGKRGVNEAWRICNDKLGDDAPTQGEVIQLLGQLYSANLIRGEIPPDSEGLFKRYRKRKSREIGGYLGNVLFLRIPLFDPDRLLEQWLGVSGWIFSKVGFVLWAIVVALGIHSLSGQWTALMDQSQNILNPSNLLWLYACFAVVKFFHEFGHAMACKKFGQTEGGGGEVHTVGVMMLVFTPMPYVDASSSWTFRNKFHRMVVGAAGMYIEIAIAAVAAMIWSRTASGTTVHAICYNVMFIASVSTLIFNGNPLLRYDGYYILSDLLEMPNLSQRAKNQLYYIVRHYVWGVRNAMPSAHNTAERIWFIIYAIASSIYRILICASILLFIAEKLFLVGVILAAASIVMWVFMPVGKFIKYLATSSELIRTRGRAVISTVIVIGGLLSFLGFYGWPDTFRAEGVVEADNMGVVYALADGELVFIRDTDTKCSENNELLFRCENHDLISEYDAALADAKRLEISQDKELRDGNYAAAKAYKKQYEANKVRIARLKRDIDNLSVKADRDGIWIAPREKKMLGKWLKRGEMVGVVLDRSKIVLRVAVEQDEGPRLMDNKDVSLEFRLKGRPGDRGEEEMTGTVSKIIPSGQSDLPKPLSFVVGGSIMTNPDDRQGTKSMERFFEVFIDPAEKFTGNLRPGQRVIVRFTLPNRPLLVQWYRIIEQIFQKRFHS